MSELTPREIVNELDRYIIGQNAAKRAVAIALRNRWRRMQLEPALRDEVTPKNILMIGPTGVGKTEIARRLAASGERAVHQGRGDQVHRGRLRRQGRRADHPRPRRRRRQDGARAGQDARALAGRGSRRGPHPRCAAAAPPGRRLRRRAAGRRSARRRHAPEAAQAAARRRARRARDRDRNRDERRRRDHGAAGHGGNDQQLRGMFQSLAGQKRRSASSRSRRRARC